MQGRLPACKRGSSTRRAGVQHRASGKLATARPIQGAARGPHPRSRCPNRLRGTHGLERLGRNGLKLCNGLRPPWQPLHRTRRSCGRVPSPSAGRRRARRLERQAVKPKTWQAVVLRHQRLTRVPMHGVAEYRMREVTDMTPHLVVSAVGSFARIKALRGSRHEARHRSQVEASRRTPLSSFMGLSMVTGS